VGSFPKFGHPAFSWIALAPLLVATVLAARTNVHAAPRLFRLGFVAGFVYFAGALYWVVQVMTTYGGLAAWTAVPVALLLYSYLALFPATFTLIVGRAVRTYGVAGLWIAPAVWVATEWVRAWLLSGFPWALLGSSQASVLPIVQFASVTGVYGLSLLVAFVSTAAAVFTLTRQVGHRVAVAGVALFLAVAASMGAFRVAGGELTSTGEVMRVGLLQGNVSQDVKWDPAYREPILRSYVDLSRQVIRAGARLVVWPEASTPFYFDMDPVLADPVRRLAAETRTPMLIGTDEFERGANGDPDRYYNAAVLVGPDGRTMGSYRKMRLVPFGEYVPLKRLLFFVGPLVEAVSDFTPGVDPVVFEVDGRRLSVAICYESVYPWIPRAFATRGAQLLAVITNDAWFGRSSAAYQHFEQGAIRAVEQGRYLVRAANTGISGAVDPYGRTLASTPLFEQTALSVDVRLLDHRTIYSYLGDVVAWLSAVLTVVAVLVTRRPAPALKRNEAQ